MAERLPPLIAVRYFEAAARHLSFTNAALELHVTHSAISHQIKALEEWLGDCREVTVHGSSWHFSEVAPLAFGGRSRFQSGLCL